MAAIQFYHLTSTPLERALPKLLEKCLAGGFTAQVVVREAQIDALNELLWTYDPNSFLPHGSSKDGHVEQQPVLLTTHVEPQNPANVLFVTDGSTPPGSERFERILDVFDGSDPEQVAAARSRWSLYKNAGHPVTYMKQTESGWEQKAA
jgi:DNA polymerase-3 subunit chi